MTPDHSNHIETYFSQVREIAAQIPIQQVQAIADYLVAVREARGRLFILGVGGSAANCSHAVNDFRKLCGIECYAPTDNVSELTARINDEGWDGAFAAWLDGSRLAAKDALLILSVGGGNAEKQVSVNLIRAIEYAKLCGSTVLGIVGRDGGFTKRMGDAVVVVPTVDDRLVTPHAEAFQAVVWHCLVSHPQLQICSTKW
jgi:D-sedoheptulose 7-phosphate isomerase